MGDSLLTELAVPGATAVTERADEELRDAGWTRSADWDTADEAWVAPVVPFRSTRVPSPY